MAASGLSQTTRWRRASVVPETYDDLPALVKAARQARDATVEFDWRLDATAVRELRRAVYEWGRSLQGRYRAFDARMLAALNEGLGETDSVYTLQAPRNARGTVGDVTCTRDGGAYRLRGHTTFDVIFVYGSAGASPRAPGSEHLGPAVRHVLTDAVVSLGWDVALLQAPEFEAVLNALYGLPLDYGIEARGTPSGPAAEARVRFHGPFQAMEGPGCRGLFRQDIAGRSGIYLWTIVVDGEDRPWYVGQTRRSFGTRISEHLAAMLSGQYGVHDAAALRRGEHRLADGGITGRWPESLPAILANYERLVPDILGVIREVRFHAAPLEGDARLHDRVEGMLGRFYKLHQDERLRQFLMPGLRLPALIPGERRLRLTSEAPIAGLPDEIQE